jgi:hypothetical protein
MSDSPGRVVARENPGGYTLVRCGPSGRLLPLVLRRRDGEVGFVSD